MYVVVAVVVEVLVVAVVVEDIKVEVVELVVIAAT